MTFIFEFTLTKPLIVNDSIKDICIKDTNYEWIEVYPDNGKYAITIMFDDKGNLIEWYFDIAKNTGLENGIPYEDDLYLDMIITPSGKMIVIDEDELISAYNNSIITKDDFDGAYKTLEELKNKYVENFDELLNLTNYLCEQFKSNNKVKR